MAQIYATSPKLLYLLHYHLKLSYNDIKEYFLSQNYIFPFLNYIHQRILFNI